MDPTVVAAWIAAGVSVLTLAGTLAAQYLGFRATTRDAEKTAEEQRRQLDRTQAEQREQLDKTLKAQSDQLDRTLSEQRDQLDRTLAEQNQQLDRTLAEQRTRTLNERFATAAGQLGSDKPAIRLAGVYAMAGLAGDWVENRQTCVDVLCAYLRMPYEPDPGSDAPEVQRLTFQAFREVRHTVIRVITAHLRDGSAVSWQGLNLDFTGVAFDGGDFSDARFSSGRVSFRAAKFDGGLVSFDSARFCGGDVRFSDARFSGGTVYFSDAGFCGGEVRFGRAGFCGGDVSFHGARFSGGTVDFSDAGFCGGEVRFGRAVFCGGEVRFRGARFSGGTVDFSKVRDWSVSPEFPWADTPPPGVKLPPEAA